MNKQIIAAFDFDGTITTKDTLFDFIQFYHGLFKLGVGLLVLSPMLALFKIGLIKNSTAKQLMFSYFFKGQNMEVFNQKCQAYIHRINEILNPEITKKIDFHKAEGHQIVIVSASITNWIKPWAYKKGFERVIGTEIEVNNNIITGRFATPNCYGKQKALRLSKIYPKRNEYILYAYGDSSGDSELLAMADHPTKL